MRTNPYESYMETEILTADPLKLVIFLYRGALDSVTCARRHLANGDIRARSQSITKTMNIVGELIRSLDFETGAEISVNLARLYEYMLSRLAEANARQIDPPLVDVEELICTLLQSWQSCQASLAQVNSIPEQEETSAVHERLSCAY